MDKKSRTCTHTHMMEPAGGGARENAALDCQRPCHASCTNDLKEGQQKALAPWMDVRASPDVAHWLAW